MARLTYGQDAYGHAMYDHHLGRGGYEVDERDDGFVGVAGGAKAYSAEYNDWMARQLAVLKCPP